MKKTSRISAIIIAVISIVCLMAISASAAISCSSYYVFMNETENYKVGQTANIPASRYTADLASSDYGVQNTYTYSFSDSSMVKVSGEKVTFVKEGTLTLTIKHNQKFERTGKTSSHTDTIAVKSRGNSFSPRSNVEEPVPPPNTTTFLFIIPYASRIKFFKSTLCSLKHL